jgi:hypothetical protein
MIHPFLSVATGFVALAAGSAMAGSATSSAFAVGDDGTAGGISVSAASVNGVPPVASQTRTGPGTFVSATASSTPGGSASAYASASASTTTSTSLPRRGGLGTP